MAPLSKTPHAGSMDASDEVCPVCKSSRYLNASLRFLINPACYHKMCESCVDRIFTHGPAPCPIINCRQTLRKGRFRTQTFEDIAVEREVDIRRDLAALFNRSEDEFDTLRNFNDYLQEVEDLAYDLITPSKESRQKQEEYAKMPAADRPGWLLKLRPSVSKPRGLRAKPKAKPLTPIRAFDFEFESEYYELANEYSWDVLQDASKDPLIRAGGYDVSSFTKRALCEAFSGLGCFVGDEAWAREARDAQMEDVF